MRHLSRTLALTILATALAFSQEPKTAAEWEQLGMKQHSSGNYKEAVVSFQKAVDMGYAPVGRFNLACALARAGEPDKAVAVLKQPIERGAVFALATDDDLASLRDRDDFKALVALAKSNAEPCMDAQRHPEHRQFDFWIGEWDVFDPAGNRVGDSRIDLILKNCTLQENWTGRGAGSGKSFNAYSPALKKWQQFWTADGGNTMWFVGELVDGEMRFIADGKANGLPFDRRLTFSKLPGGKVRQHSERSGKDGWTTEYDFTYVPKSK